MISFNVSVIETEDSYEVPIKDIVSDSDISNGLLKSLLYSALVQMLSDND